MEFSGDLKWVPGLEQALYPVTEGSLEKLRANQNLAEAGKYKLAAILGQFCPEHQGVALDYFSAGLELGYWVSYVPIGGECSGFDQMLERWGNEEAAYAMLGYLTAPIQEFLNFEVWKKPFATKPGTKRPEGQEPIFWAQVYQERHRTKPGEVAPAFQAMATGKVVVANVPIPDTGAEASHYLERLKPQPTRTLAGWLRWLFTGQWLRSPTGGP